MKNPIYLLAIIVTLLACNNVKQETGKKELQFAELIEETASATSIISYHQCHLAYLVDGALYFYSLEQNKKIKFVEEPDTIYNFVFNDKGNKLYYSVERDDELWMKEVDISESPVTPEWVHAWTLKRDEELANGYPSQLLFREVEELYHDGELLLEYDFDISSYDFRKFDIYNLAYERTTTKEKEGNWGLIEDFKKEIPYDKLDDYFEIKNGQLYYMRNKPKVSLTDKLDIKALKTEEDTRFGEETEFGNYTFSPDETKILFKIMLGYNEETFHGPYVIANADGSQQMILEKADESWNIHPKWLKDNRILFNDRDGNLYVASNKDNSVQKIAENVTSYLAK